MTDDRFKAAFGYSRDETGVELSPAARCNAADSVMYKDFRYWKDANPGVFDLMKSDAYIAALTCKVDTSRPISSQVSYVRYACRNYIFKLMNRKKNNPYFTQIKQVSLTRRVNGSAYDYDPPAARDELITRIELEAVRNALYYLMLYAGPRAAQVLPLLAAGWDVHEIAAKLNVRHYQTIHETLRYLRKRIKKNKYMREYLVKHIPLIETMI